MEEEIVSFKKIEDRIVYGVQTPDGTDLMATISGYDLNIAFNMRHIHSLADAEACANGIADVMYQALMSQLLSSGLHLEKQTTQSG